MLLVLAGTRAWLRSGEMQARWRQNGLPVAAEVKHTWDYAGLMLKDFTKLMGINGIDSMTCRSDQVETLERQFCLQTALCDVYVKIYMYPS